MRVLFVTYELPPIGGGGGRAAWQIARRLAGRGHDVRILTSLFGGLPGCEAREGVGIHRIAVLRSRADACSPRELLSFMRRSVPETRRLARDFAPGFFVRLQQKDLRLALSAAEELGVSLPGTALVHQLFRAPEAEGKGELGTQALVQVLERLAGREVDRS